MSDPIPPSTRGKAWQPLTPEELQPELPQYVVLSLLGRGGMGAVYKTVQASIGVAAGLAVGAFVIFSSDTKADIALEPPPLAPSSDGLNSGTTLPPELATLDAAFIKLQTERVTAPFEADFAKLHSGYLSGIGKKIAEEKAAGNLDGILALETEQKLITEKQPVPESDEEKTPASLKALRGIYRTAYAKLFATRVANLKALTEPLDKRLAQMESDFAKTDRLADAKTVRGYREALAEAGSVGVSSAQAASPQSAQNAGAPATTLAVNPSAILAMRDGYTNTLGMKFVPVKGTEVLFCIHEVRYKDYAAYAAENSDVNGDWKNQTNEGFKTTERSEDHPVTKVSWEDAQKFCEWLNKKEGKTYRLPTDREWSIAVGLGTKEKPGEKLTPEMLSGKESSEFPWGGDYPPRTKDKAGNYSDESRRFKMPSKDGRYVEDGYDDGFPSTAPVMSFKSNKFGLYDMGGNVWEWCEDWWNAEEKGRVLRGASFGDLGRGGLLSSYRLSFRPGTRDGGTGFRVVVVR